MTSFSWFSGKRWPSRKFMMGLWEVVESNARASGSERGVADDPGALHLAVARRVVDDRIVLGAAVVPHRHRVRLPAEAHLVLGDEGLGDQVLKQLRGAGCVVLADAHVGGGVEVGEVRREGVDVQDLLAGQ